MNRRPHRITIRMSHDEHNEFVKQWGTFQRQHPYRRTVTDFVQFSLEQQYERQAIAETAVPRLSDSDRETNIMSDGRSAVRQKRAQRSPASH